MELSYFVRSCDQALCHIPFFHQVHTNTALWRLKSTREEIYTVEQYLAVDILRPAESVFLGAFSRYVYWSVAPFTRCSHAEILIPAHYRTYLPACTERTRVFVQRLLWRLSVHLTAASLGSEAVSTVQSHWHCHTNYSLCRPAPFR